MRIRTHDDRHIILPMLCDTTGNCQFCSIRTDKPKITLVSRVNNVGYVSCENCHSTARETANRWIEQEAWFGLSHFRQKPLKIKRRSGQIESGWFLNEDNRLEIYINDEPYVDLCNLRIGVRRYVKASNLLELNQTA